MNLGEHPESFPEQFHCVGQHSTDGLYERGLEPQSRQKKSDLHEIIIESWLTASGLSPVRKLSRLKGQLKSLFTRGKKKLNFLGERPQSTCQSAMFLNSSHFGLSLMRVTLPDTTLLTVLTG